MEAKFTPLVIGIAGGTASGKTTVAEVILERVGADAIAYLTHDAYYRDLSAYTPEERMRFNFDHPDALETSLMVEHVRALRAGRAIECPIYDYATHTRLPRTRRIEPQHVVIVEGILVFVERALRELFDVKIFVDADPDIRFIRRLRRDTRERGRSFEAVIEQYLTTVRPMHLEFVEPSKRYADVIIPEGGHNTVALDMVTARIERLLAGRARV
jgi:uridine kinase